MKKWGSSQWKGAFLYLCGLSLFAFTVQAAYASHFAQKLWLFPQFSRPSLLPVPYFCLSISIYALGYKHLKS